MARALLESRQPPAFMLYVITVSNRHGAVRGTRPRSKHQIERRITKTPARVAATMSRP